MRHNAQAFDKGIKQVRYQARLRRRYVHPELTAHLGALSTGVFLFSHNLADVAGFGPADPVRSR